MASILQRKTGTRAVRFYALDGSRRTLSLGKCSKRDAERVAIFIERILEKRRLGQPLDGETTRWVASLPDVLRDRLSQAGLIEARQTETLGRFLASWMASRAQYKVTSRDAWSRSVNDLLRFFGEETPLQRVDHAAAERFRQHLVERGLRDTTIHKRLQHVRLFFKAAMQQGRLDSNPFQYVTHRAGRQDERRVYVSSEDTERVIRRCPNATWRLLVVLARYAGLRTPSEPFSLRWCDILWDEDRFIVNSPKTGPRAVPLFPRVREALEEAWEVAPDGAEYVLPEELRRRAEGPRGLRNANLRTSLLKIIRRAGLSPWPRPWHNLRASCETDLVNRYPLPVVAKWLGNTSMIAMRHYVDVTDEHFRQAAQRGPEDRQRAPIGAPVDCTNGRKTAEAAACQNAASPENTELCDKMRTSANTPIGGGGNRTGNHKSLCDGVLGKQPLACAPVGAPIGAPESEIPPELGALWATLSDDQKQVLRAALRTLRRRGD